MTAVEVLLGCRVSGIHLRAVNGELRASPARSLPPDLLVGLREHKATLLPLLADVATVPSTIRARLRWLHEGMDAVERARLAAEVREGDRLAALVFLALDPEGEA